MVKTLLTTTLIVIQILILNFADGRSIVNGLNNSYNNDCRNPNGKPGVCISLYYCPTLLRTFLNMPNNTNVEDQVFLHQSSCLNGFGSNQFVCCTNQVNFRKKSPATTVTELTPASLLASPEECTGPYTIYQYGTQVADIKDYHWTGILQYDKNDNTFRHRCQGSLISHRYVLTTAHCIIKGLQPLRVRFGEYDLSTEIDCDDDFCLDPVIYVDVEKRIPHSQFDLRRLKNDIGLLRLANHVAYGKSISPVCLPSTIGFNGSNTGEGLFLVGFDSSGNVTKKLQVNLPVFDQNNCTEIYKKLHVEIPKTQMCAGGNPDGESNADSGEALTRQFTGKWIIEGMVSFGLIELPKGVPMIFTRISDFENWIIENIEP